MRLIRAFLLIVALTFGGCATTDKKVVSSEPLMMQAEPTSKKIWVEAETKRVWVNGHVDENGDMVEGHYKHIIVTPGHWTVEESGK